MSTKQKLLEKISQNPNNVAFKDLDKLLTWYGFECRQPGGGSSHFIYKIKVQGQSFRLTVPYKRPHIKRTYVQNALAIFDQLEEMGWHLEP